MKNEITIDNLIKNKKLCNKCNKFYIIKNHKENSYGYCNCGIKNLTVDSKKVLVDKKDIESRFNELN